MKQKLLLSTFLSTLILTSFNAKADVTIDFNPQGKIKIDFISHEAKIILGSLPLHISKEEGSNQIVTSFPPNNDALIDANGLIRFPEENQAKLLDILSNGNEKINREIYNNYTAIIGINRDKFTYDTFTKKVNSMVRFLTELGIPSESFVKLIDIRYVLQDEDHSPYLLNFLERNLDLFKTASNGSSRIKEIKNKNPELYELENKYLTLEKDKNVDINAKIKAADELYSRPEYSAVKQSAENQDKLKLTIKIIQELEQYNGNFTVSRDAAKDVMVENIKIELSRYITKDPKAASDLTPVQAPEGKTTYGVFNAVNPVTSDIGARLNNFVGVSAGSIMQRVGAWAKGIYSTGDQKTTGLSDGFKYNLAGGSIGVDVGEQNVVGVAYSFLSNKIESKLKNATKDEIPLHILSLYGMLSPNNELFITGQFQYGFGKVKKTRNTGDSAGSVAKAEPKTDLIRVSGQIGYAFTIPNTDASVVPTIGINHSTVNMDGYTEKGPGVNRTINKMSFSRTAGTFGVSYRYTIKNGETIIEPEIHANGDYAFNIKNDDTKITIIKGLDSIVVPSEKTQKFLYSVGASVKLSPSRMIEINGGYDFTGGKDFTAHTGTITLRVNF